MLAVCFAVAGCYTDDPFEGGDDLRRPNPWDTYMNQPLSPGMVRVMIERTELIDNQEEVIEAALRYRNDDVDVRVGGPLSGRGGLRVFAVSGEFRGALRYDRRRQTSRQVSQQFLSLMAGGTASFQALRITPKPWTVVIPIWRGVVIVDTIREEITGTGMFVTVHSIRNGWVDVELTPYFNRARDGHAIKVEELATRVTVRPGQPYVLMADRSDNSSTASQLLSRRTRRERSQLITVMTVETGPPLDGPPPRFDDTP